MVILSAKSQELLRFMRNEYIENGYLHSGSWPYISLIERGYDKATISELLKTGMIQKRNCEDYAFELSSHERGILISKNNLSSVWFEKMGIPFLPDIQQEVRNTANIPCDKENALITVRTMKPYGDNDKPEYMDVTCPFTVGQVIDIEYDLPKKMRHIGYSGSEDVSPGRRVGQFLVTDIIHNLMVYPRMNMIEIQSLCEDFNKFYPYERSMTVFEDVLLKRINNKSLSLSEQIQSASSRTIGTYSSYKASVKETLPER